MQKRPFIITIDTEGDNLWARPRHVTTENARWLPRFQALCDRFGFRPTYLTNYEMATSDAFAGFAREVLADGRAEIGMHLHAWNTPPLTGEDRTNPGQSQAYLIEYPAREMESKIVTMTRLLEDTFSRSMLSHRAGRWALNPAYARLLVKHGYRYDCSVTPFVDWQSHPGAGPGSGGSNYLGAPASPYYLSHDDVLRPGDLGLLEIPMSIRRPERGWLVEALRVLPLARRAANRLWPEVVWMRPNRRNERHLVNLCRQIAEEDAPYLQFMLHSSELMPGGSPTFRTEADIDALYAGMERVFQVISQHFHGCTLADYGQTVPAE
jgi:hypothetical protein